MLLNNDCYVTPETIGTLVRLWRDRPDSIIAPVQRDWRTGEVLCIAPRSLFLLGFPTWIGPRALTAEIRSRELLPVGLICGGRGVILSRAVLEANGLFDEERLPHYGADHDFYLRARKRGIALYTATPAIVDIDHTRTSLANDPGRLTVRDFLDTLQSARSHRNIPHMTQLFRLHYPVKHLHMIGVALYTARYVTLYALRRIRMLVMRAA
jgi:GT2 family glycosyltransferase